MRSKKELAVYLSKLLPLESHNLFLEQYSTPSELAAELVAELAAELPAEPPLEPREDLFFLLLAEAALAVRLASL